MSALRQSGLSRTVPLRRIVNATAVQSRSQAFLRHNSSSPIGETTMDQTKEDNDPSKAHNDEHKSRAKMTDSTQGRDHPAKQADPQQTPSRSTGFEKEGPNGKAGEGRDEGVTKDQGALDRA